MTLQRQSRSSPEVSWPNLRLPVSGRPLPQWDCELPEIRDCLQLPEKGLLNEGRLSTELGWPWGRVGGDSCRKPQIRVLSSCLLS